MKQNKTEQSWMQGPRAFSVIEALVGAAIIGMGLAAISGAINYSTSQYSKLKGATDSILAHTEVLKAVQAQNMQASQIISLCKKIKVKGNGGGLVGLSGQNINNLNNTSNFIQALEVGTGDCGNGTPCQYTVGQRVPPNFDVTVRQIAVEADRDASGNFQPVDANFKMNVCEYPNNSDLQNSCSMGQSLPESFKVYQLDLAIITSREKSDTATGIAQNAQGEVEFNVAQEARIYTPLKIPMTIYTHSDKIVACSLSKVLHACKRTVSGDLNGDGGGLLVKGTLENPEELTCDLRVAALQGLPQLGSKAGHNSEHFCISGPLYAVQKAGGGPYGCNAKVGNIAYNALVCEKGCGDTELVGEGFYTRQMLQWDHEREGVKIFHCVKCLGPGGAEIEPCLTGLECSVEARRDAFDDYKNCLKQVIENNSDLTADACGFDMAGSDQDVNSLESCCSNQEGCRKALHDCARRAGPEVAANAGAAWWRKPCPEKTTNADGTEILNLERDDDGMCPVDPEEALQACTSGAETPDAAIEGNGNDPQPVQPQDAAAQQDTKSMMCDLIDRCNMIAGGDSIKAQSVNYDWPQTELNINTGGNSRIAKTGHFYKFRCPYPSEDQNAKLCPAGGTLYSVPAVLLAERIPKYVLGGEYNAGIEGTDVQGYYYPQAQNSPRAPLMRKKNKYYHPSGTSDVPFVSSVHQYNSGETALEAINRRKNSYAYACWADREPSSQDNSIMKWRLDPWNERRQRLRDERTAHQNPSSAGNYDNTSDIRNVRSKRAGDYDFYDTNPHGSARYRGNFLYHDGLSLLKKIAGLYKTLNDHIPPDIDPQDKVNVEMPGDHANGSPRQNNIRRSWLACATEELGFWNNDDGVHRPTGLDDLSGCAENVEFRVTCNDSDGDGNCDSCSITDATSLSVYKDLSHPSSTSCSCDNCENRSSTSFPNPWLRSSTDNGTGNYEKWREAFIEKLAAYMKRDTSNGYWGLGKDAEDKDGITAERLLKNSSGGFKSNIEIAKNFWKWFSLVHCDTYHYSQPVYRHRFACARNMQDMTSNKLVDTTEGSFGAYECCAKWAGKYNFGDRVDVDANGNHIALSSMAPLTNSALYTPTPQIMKSGRNVMHSETYFIGPSDPGKCRKEDLSSPASQ